MRKRNYNDKFKISASIFWDFSAISPLLLVFFKKNSYLKNLKCWTRESLRVRTFESESSPSLQKGTEPSSLQVQVQTWFRPYSRDKARF